MQAIMWVMRTTTQRVLPAVFILLLMACGQKGPLYLPKNLNEPGVVPQNNYLPEQVAPATPGPSP